MNSRSIQNGAAAVFLSLLAVTSVSAQNTDTGFNDRGTMTRVDDDRGMDWGWIGLLGLAGLAGLRRRPVDTRDRDIRTGTAPLR